MLSNSPGGKILIRIFGIFGEFFITVNQFCPSRMGVGLPDRRPPLCTASRGNQSGVFVRVVVAVPFDFVGPSVLAQKFPPGCPATGKNYVPTRCFSISPTFKRRFHHHPNYKFPGGRAHYRGWWGRGLNRTRFSCVRVGVGVSLLLFGKCGWGCLSSVSQLPIKSKSFLEWLVAG